MKRNNESNNKQGMKLYTEEQILFYLTMHSSAITRYDLHNIPHIELPSDEEIEDEAGRSYESKGLVYNLGANHGFITGAKWMRDKIQGGNK